MAAMKSTTVLLTCLFGLLLILASSFGEGFEAPIQDRIRAVENGLESSNSSGQRPEHRDLLTEMKRLNVPAVSIAVVHGGKIEWAKGYGLTRADGTAVNADTLFQAASISKSITAMAALNLVEHGRLSLDAPIRTELKSWTLPQNSSTSQHPVTLRELLSNTAGTSVDGFDGYAAGQPIPTLTQILNGTKPANSAPIVVEAVPGSEFRYSGGGFTIVQQMMIDATGKPFPQIMKVIVLDPTGMRSSTYEQPIDPALLMKVALPVECSRKAHPRWVAHLPRDGCCRPLDHTFRPCSLDHRNAELARR